MLLLTCLLTVLLPRDWSLPILSTTVSPVLWRIFEQKQVGPVMLADNNYMNGFQLWDLLAKKKKIAMCLREAA